VGTPGAGAAIPVCWVKPACMAADPGETLSSWVLRQDVVLLSPVLGPKANGSRVRTQFSLMLSQDPG